MATIERDIIEIDEELCDGCELCIPSCAEGAIQMVNGKAKLVNDALCDGIGNCLGDCPQDAITVIRRSATRYDEQLVEQHLKQLAGAAGNQGQSASPSPEPISIPAPGGGCPSSQSRQFAPVIEPETSINGTEIRSQLGNWPVEIKLVPLSVPYYDGADLLVAADCVPFAHASFHQDLLAGKVLMIGCPKLDDGQFYVEKLSQIFKTNTIKSISIAFMEVPCCMGLVSIVRMAIEASGKQIPASAVRIGIKGGILNSVPLDESPF